MEVFRKSSRTVLCSFCKAPAVSVCSFASEAFNGCQEPFCEDHGLPVPGYTSYSLAPQKNENHQGSLDGKFRETIKKVLALKEEHMKEFRSCYLCLNQRSKEESRRRTSIFVKSLCAFLLVTTLTLVLSLREQARIECSDDSILSVQMQQCFQLEEEPKGWDYLYWLQHNNPGVYKCQMYEKRMLASCYCPEPMGGVAYVKLLQDGTRDHASSSPTCPVFDDCTPDGSSQVYAGLCQRANPDHPIRTIASGKRINGQLPRCSALGIYMEEGGFCVYTSCTSNFYYTSLETYQCLNCPMFKAAITSFFCSEFMYILVDGRIDWYPELDGQWYLCPPDRGPPARLSKFIEQRGYYFRKTWYKYFVCPIIVEEKNRICNVSEMLIRHMIKCTSRCKPCVEQWDYALRKCVPGETRCEEFGYTLMSTGECRSLINLETYWEIFGMTVCD